MDFQNETYQNQKSECPNLDALKGKQPFVVPDGFFESQLSQIELKQKYRSKSNSGLEIPEHYFERMQAQIASQVSLPAPQHSDADLWKTPENYFVKSKAQIQAQIQMSKPRKLQFNPYKWYAAAAMLVVILSVSIFWFKTTQPTSTNELAVNFNENGVQQNTKKLSSNSESAEIENYLINYYSADDLARN